MKYLIVLQIILLSMPLRAMLTTHARHYSNMACSMLVPPILSSLFVEKKPQQDRLETSAGKCIDHEKFFHAQQRFKKDANNQDRSKGARYKYVGGALCIFGMGLYLFPTFYKNICDKKKDSKCWMGFCFLGSYEKDVKKDATKLYSYSYLTDIVSAAMFGVGINCYLYGYTKCGLMTNI